MATGSLGFSYFKSAPGKKLLMGLTGLVWSGFVFGHMAGNFLLFIGPDAYNLYGHMLTSGNIIYVIESILIISLLVHIVCAISLTLSNKKARGPNTYAMTSKSEKKIYTPSRYMAIQGSLLLFFIITHLIGFKFGTVYHTQIDGVIIRDLHRLVLEVFSQPVAVAWYLVALVALGFHLSHGFGSIFQSLGITNPRNAVVIKKMSYIYATVVSLGFIAQPLYVFLTR